MGVIIRSSRLEDVRRMSYIHAESWRVAYRGMIDDDYLDKLSDERWVAPFENNFKVPQPRFRGLVLEIDGVLGGVLHYGRSRDEDLSDWGEIASCYLLPEYWGLNLGHQLLRKGIDCLRAEGYPGVLIWTLDTNLRAQKAYKRLGLAHDGTSKDIEGYGSIIIDIRFTMPL